jgi:mono/diheme cytochrome c family protein
MTFQFIACASLTALLLLSCKASDNTRYDPLRDYKQLRPTTELAPPAATANPNFSKQDVEHGRYLVGLLGCGSCHTNGALVGAPHLDQLLAGSDTGIAWTNPLVDRNPGIVYPANLTPDIETGIGSWSMAEIIAMLKTGADKHSGQTLPIMPWPSYSQIHDDDANAIAAYLKSLPAVRHAVPKNVRQGLKASAPYIHFGVYQSKQ